MFQLCIFFILAFIIPLGAFNVGLLIMATGKYDRFITPLIESAELYFLPDHNVTYYVFTDGIIPERENLVVIPQQRLGWPFDTLKRYHVYYKNKKRFINEDFLFAIDADTLFRGKVGDEILGDLVATLHHGFLGRRGTYETNPASHACVNSHEGTYYFAGGFYGGKNKSFLKAIKTIIDRIDNDLARGIVAIWHDESHWNRYCIDHPPTVILPSAYCYADGYSFINEIKIEALTKRHDELRQ